MEALVKDTLAALVRVHNLRQQIAKAKLEGGELAKYGMAKRPDLHGIDTYVDGDVRKGEHYNMDPTGRRDGNGA